jgi:hypothetical protein
MCQPAAQLVPRVAGAPPVFYHTKHGSHGTLRRLGSTLRRTGAYLSRSTCDPGGQKSFPRNAQRMADHNDGGPVLAVRTRSQGCANATCATKIRSHEPTPRTDLDLNANPHEILTAVSSCKHLREFVLQGKVDAVIRIPRSGAPCRSSSRTRSGASRISLFVPLVLAGTGCQQTS